MNNSRGGAYVFVLIMSLSLALMLAVAANTTAYEAQVSRAARDYSNLSALAYAGAERAVFAANRLLEEKRPELAASALQSVQAAGGDYWAAYAGEAYKALSGTAFEFALSLPDSGRGGLGGVYTVSAQISPNDGAGLKLTSRAGKDGLPTGETVTAVLLCGGAETAAQGEGFAAVRGGFGLRIEKIIQNR